MEEDIFTLLSFTAEHNCWSNMTRNSNREQLYVRILTSYPIIGEEKLFTAISVYGIKEDVKEFIVKLKDANNVSKIISTSQFYDIRSQKTNNLLVQFIVDSENTITSVVSLSKPISFTVKIFEGIEQWNVYFSNPMKYQVSRLVKTLKSNFLIKHYLTRPVSIGYLYEAPNKFYISLEEAKFIGFLLKHGFFDSPRALKLRDLSKELNMSSSNLSRKAREIEQKIFERILQSETI